MSAIGKFEGKVIGIKEFTSKGGEKTNYSVKIYCTEGKGEYIKKFYVEVVAWTEFNIRQAKYLKENDIINIEGPFDVVAWNGKNGPAAGIKSYPYQIKKTIYISKKDEEGDIGPAPEDLEQAQPPSPTTDIQQDESLGF